MLARFISPDSIVPDPTDPQAFNRYSYVRNNPLIYTDPSGNSWLSEAFHDVEDWVSDHKQEITGMALQALGGAFFLPGTYMLSQTATGRTILAAELAIGAAIVGYYYYPVAGGTATSQQYALEFITYGTDAGYGAGGITIPPEVIYGGIIAGGGYMVAGVFGGWGGNNGGGGNGGGGGSGGGTGTSGGMPGSSYGDYAAQYWANLSVNHSNTWYESSFYYAMGLSASLWTPETSSATFSVLSTAAGFRWQGVPVEPTHIGFDIPFTRLNIIHYGRHIEHGRHIGIGFVGSLKTWKHIYFNPFRIWP